MTMKKQNHFKVTEESWRWCKSVEQEMMIHFGVSKWKAWTDAR